MRDFWHSCRALVPGLFAALAVLGLAACATTAPPPPNESLLAAAGFKRIEATRREQQLHLQALAPGRVSAMQRNGREFYVYPDPSGKALYVGTPKEFAAYQQGRTQGGPGLSAQANADMASYAKQDVAMQQATTRDMSDPWLWWPDFGAMNW